MSKAQLLKAAGEGRLNEVKRLLAYEANFDCADDRGRTPLMLAAEAGHVDIVQLLIDRGATMNQALIKAAMNGHETTVRLLIDHGADVNAPDEDQYTSLIKAAMYGHETVARLLIDHGADVNATNKYQTTPLIMAARRGRETVVRLLIEHGADVNATNDRQIAPLMMAAANGNETIVRLLIDHGADVNATNNLQMTPLMMAAKNGHETIARLLIDHGADVNATNIFQMTPLMMTATNGHETIARLLIDHGADVNATNNLQMTPLMMAATNGHENVVQLLIDHGANVNAADEDEMTPLMLAAENGLKDYVQLLFDHGADVNIADKNKCTPLMFAAVNGHVDIAQILIDHRADVNIADKNLWSPLMWATQYGREDVVQLLIDSGASVDATSNDTQTALMFAAQDGKITIAQALISRGASIDATNGQHQTALMLAASEGHTEVVRILLDKGASIGAMDKNDETAMMYAIDNSHESVMRELLNVETGMVRGMALMKLGLQKRRVDAAAKKKANEQAMAEVTLEDLVHLCSKMNEAQTISERICSRLADVEKQITTLNELAKQEASTRFKQLVDQTHGFMVKYADKHTVTRFVGSQVVIEASRDLNRQLDAFLLQFNILIDANESHIWKDQWEESSVAMKPQLIDSLKNNNVLLNELQDPQVQKEALTLLMFECDNRGSQYSEEEMKLIHNLFQYVSSMFHLQIDSVPEWFVPPHEVDFNSNSWFAKGSYGFVHHGTWNRTTIVVKSALLTDDDSRDMFLKETDIWFKLQHPHIVTLFRACHIGNPFFVCDYASNGILSDYLCRAENQFKAWAKLYEAALGLEYLHTKHKVVHGDLKCNNILISADEKAKLTDFGLSFVLKNGQNESPPTDEVGAINWKAPEVISRKTRGTFASDVYSFGMCIVEAVSGRIPFGTMPDIGVKTKVVTLKSLPNQPPELTDTQWDLVKRMCAWEPADRITMSEAVKVLEELAEKEWGLKMDALDAEYEATRQAT